MILLTLAAASAAVLGASRQAENTPNLYHQPDYCRQVVQREIERQTVAFQGARPAAEYALDRQVEGCGVPTPVGYHPSAPPDDARREDAPSNRR